MKMYMNTLMLTLIFFITTLEAHGHHRHPHGPPPRGPPPRFSSSESRHGERSHETSENSNEEREKQFFNAHHLPDEDLEHFKDRMKRIHESVQICTHPHTINSNQTENKQVLQQNSEKLQKVIDFHIVIRSLIDANKRKFAAIEEFVGYFKINVPDDEIPQVVHDFIIKILEIEQKDSITLQMSNEIEQNIQKAQETQDQQETVQEMNEEAKKLFAEKAEENRKFLADLIQALKEIADKYNGGESDNDDVNVNGQKPDEETQTTPEQKPEEQQQPEVQQPEEQTPVVEQPEQNTSPTQETVSKEELLKQKQEFEEKLKEMEEKQQMMQKQLDDLLNNQQILNQQQKDHQDKISQIKTLENGLDDMQHSKTQDTIEALNHLQNLQNHPDAQPFLKPLQDLYHALRPQSE